MAERKTFIDIAKGLGIILVILGHLDTDGQISREVIYAFHMPFFFVLSGIFANTKIDFKSYFKNSFYSLYLPYLIFVVIDTILFSVIKFIQGGNVIELVKSNVLSLLGFNFEVSNRPLWFLLALFIIRLVFYFANKNKVIKYSLAILCVAFVFVKNGALFSVPEKCVFIMAIPGLFFYIIGNVAKKYILNFDDIVNSKKLIFSVVLIACFALFIFTAHKNGSIDMTIYQYGNSLFYFINAILGTFVFLILSAFLASFLFPKKALSFYGVNSIVILIFHYYIARKVIPILMNHIGLGEYTFHPITQLVALTVILLKMVPVILIANKYFYFMFGKKRPTLIKKT
ncbi:MAG: acyltransferase family protein [Eubacterium sp.]|nr:acyltransferase family protein [Eubacterium sp.]